MDMKKNTLIGCGNEKIRKSKIKSFKKRNARPAVTFLASHL